MPPIMTLGCAHGNHEECKSTKCECPCHKDLALLRQEAQAKRMKARQVAHTAVMHFDHNPDLVNTQAAILALTQYERALKEARHGR